MEDKRELLVDGFIRDFLRNEKSISIPNPLIKLMFEFFWIRGISGWVDKDIVIRVSGNEDGRDTDIGRYLSVHGTCGDKISHGTNVRVISHANERKKGIWRIEKSKKGHYVLHHLGCVDGRNLHHGKGYYLGVHIYHTL